jgi:hypothetical protein
MKFPATVIILAVGVIEKYYGQTGTGGRTADRSQSSSKSARHRKAFSEIFVFTGAL